MSQEEEIWRSYRHQDVAISRMEKNHHGVVALVDTNQTSQKKHLIRSSYEEKAVKIVKCPTDFVHVSP
jgi:hypothetical protein